MCECRIHPSCKRRCHVQGAAPGSPEKKHVPTRIEEHLPEVRFFRDLPIVLLLSARHASDREPPPESPLPAIELHPVHEKICDHEGAVAADGDPARRVERMPFPGRLQKQPPGGPTLRPPVSEDHGAGAVAVHGNSHTPGPPRRDVDRHPPRDNESTAEDETRVKHLNARILHLKHNEPPPDHQREGRGPEFPRTGAAASHLPDAGTAVVEFLHRVVKQIGHIDIAPPVNRNARD
jgi:hypothetical protein